VLKGELASRQFGDAAAAAGVIVVTTKANQNSAAVKAFNERITPKVSMADALIIIDGKEATESDLEKLPKSRIKEMNVLQGAPAEAQYGAKARNGVIVVVTGQKA
jgi:ketopantoate reductase